LLFILKAKDRKSGINLVTLGSYIKISKMKHLYYSKMYDDYIIYYRHK